VKFLLPKDTKSLGNNKAPACESRGFVRKKQKVCILTHLQWNIKQTGVYSSEMNACLFMF